ncbi:MAG: alpha-1,2-fucosyltransferase [Fuerstiella sp.]|nr:alpha-1,2-fucosyltransferase [Fuerstiella sp.]
MVAVPSTLSLPEVAEDNAREMEVAARGFVTSRLTGGLGNQLFQYAAGRAASLRNDVDLVLDIRLLAVDSLRSYELHRYNIAARVGSNAELPPDRSAKFRYLLWKVGRDARKRLVTEKGLQFRCEQMVVPANAVLHGYWQNETYFCDFAEQIRQELTVATAASAPNVDWLNRIQSVNAVSMHIRRGDYVSVTKNQSIYASCSPEYYTAASTRIRDLAGSDVEFFAFSDDPDWVEKEIKVPGKLHIVRCNAGDTAYEDLRLMSACRDHVIANSSFSWWGAWLNPLPHKRVVAPRKWFVDDNERDPVPESWLRM